MDKSLKFQMKFDTSGFDRAIQEMQAKLGKIYGSSDIIKAQNQTAARLEGNGFSANSPGRAAYEASTRNHQKELNQLIANEKKELDASAQKILQKDQTLERLIQKQKAMVQGSKEELQIRERIARVDENRSRMQQEYLQKNSTLNSLLDAKERQGSVMDQLKGAYRTGAAGGGGMSGGIAGAFGKANGMLAPIGGITGLVAGIAGIAQGGIGLYRAYNQAPVESTANKGSAIQQIYGREFDAILSHRSVFERSLGAEKADAIKKASAATNAVENTRLGSAGASIAINGAKWAGIGAAAGSALPVVGTAAGAVIGGLYGVGSSAMDHKTTLGSYFSSNFNDQRQGEAARQFAENYNKALQGNIEQNPLKNMARKNLEANWQRDLNAQRMMGLDYYSYHAGGGFQDQITDAGFTNDMGVGMASSIIGAGGSTRSARGNSVLGLQMQRSMGITNSASILGKISGRLGSETATEQATLKILSEGMRLGLDSSKFREENRKFTEAAADIVSKSGATSETDVSRLIDRFGSFVTEKTGAGLSAAQSAYETYNNASKETSGPHGAMRFAGIVNDKDLNQASDKTKAAVGMLSESEMTEDHPAIKQMARESNLKPEEVIKRLQANNSNSFSRFGSVDKNIKRLRQNAENNHGSLDESNEENKKLLEEIQTSLMVEGRGTDKTKLKSLAMGLVNNKPVKFNPEDAKKQLSNNPTILQDEIVKGMAEDSKFLNQNFREFKDNIIPSANAIATFNEQLKQTVAIIGKMSETDQKKYYSLLNSTSQNLMTPATPKNQTNGAKESQ